LISPDILPDFTVNKTFARVLNNSEKLFGNRKRMNLSFIKDCKNFYARKIIYLVFSYSLMAVWDYVLPLPENDNL